MDVSCLAVLWSLMMNDDHKNDGNGDQKEGKGDFKTLKHPLKCGTSDLKTLSHPLT